MRSLGSTWYLPWLPRRPGSRRGSVPKPKKRPGSRHISQSTPKRPNSRCDNQIPLKGWVLTISVTPHLKSMDSRCDHQPTPKGRILAVTLKPHINQAVFLPWKSNPKYRVLTVAIQHLKIGWFSPWKSNPT